MSLVLLISPNPSLHKSLDIPGLKHLAVVQMPNIDATELYLASRPTDAPAIDMILLQPESNETIAIACRRLRQYQWAAPIIPLIALLNRPTERQAALEAGADDYLLLPLLPAEVELRFGRYFGSPAYIFAILTPVINQLKRGVMSDQIWLQSLKQLAEYFQAVSAWVFLLDQASLKITLTAGHSLLPLSERESQDLEEEVSRFVQLWGKQAGSQTENIGPYWIEVKQAEANHRLIMPLYSQQRLFGLLILNYDAPTFLSSLNEELLAILGQNLGVILEMQQTQQDTQVYATQSAFMLLIARTINQQFDLDVILSLTLEQVIPLFNATSGEIWLLSADKAWLDLASSLAAPLAQPSLTRRPSDKGLLGWVVQHMQAIATTTQQHDARFDLTVDQTEDRQPYSFLAAPLHHRDQIIGVVAVYGQPNLSFSNRDMVLLEGIANLAASAIVHARLLHRLREHSEQRQALYEMSRQIAAGLDLESTLNRILHWAGRLFNTEVALLWLIEEAGEALYLAAAFGIKWPLEELIEMPIGHGLVGWIAQSGEAVVTNDPIYDSRSDPIIFKLLQVTLRNLIAAPMVYHGRAIGVLCLINKHEGLFTEADLTLLSTALEMIASAVGNARLHTQTLALIEERERLSRQVLQAERLATIGRLTGALSHEINNPMQAIRGALVLALEELDSPADLTTYLNLCLQESDRVVQLLERLSQVYRPRQAEISEALEVNTLLHEAIHLASKEMKRQKVILNIALAANLPRVLGVANQLNLVFLSLLLNLSDAIGPSGGGELYIRSEALSKIVRIEFSTDLAILPIANWSAAFRIGSASKEGKLSFGLSLSQDIIVAHGGMIELIERGHWAVCAIELPAEI